MSKIIEVVAGILENERGEVLLSSRPEGKPYAGYWEFAGGKVEVGETLLAALQREFMEELGVKIHRAVAWLSKIHAYEHATVHLHFFRVAAENWSGQLQAREGQQWAWQNPRDYSVSPMLPANEALLAALALPKHFSGSLKTGLVSQKGDVYVVPFSSEKSIGNHTLFDARTWQNLAVSLPEKRRTAWVVVTNEAEFYQVSDADVVVWRVENEASAQALLNVLAQWVSVPVLAYASSYWLGVFGERWLAEGLHGMIDNQDIAEV